METQNKNLWIAIIVITVIVVGIIAWSINKNLAVAPSVGVDENKDTALEANLGMNTGKVASTGSSLNNISYADALIKYKDARIQLNQICQATPNNVTYKNNTNIMIDNRSSVAHTVKIGTTFNIKPWEFKIIKLSSATLPVTWLMDCDKSENIATILVQK
jgi:hypothetical protein